MTTHTHHVFFSYARADNGEDNNHFITRFHDLLRKEHQAVTGRELKAFFDTDAIDSGERWKTRLGQGLRDSRLFLAFLSNNYLKSEVCRWEWEHYLLTEHTAARGEDGVVPLYFIPIDELGRESEEQLAEWIEEIKARNLVAYCQLQPWYKAGSERAQELDAAERADALRQVDLESEEDLPLQERIRRLNLRICQRLDRIQLAEQVIGNVVRPYRHFVGRHQQLRELHEALTEDRTELLATVYSPGGLGKSALARQYAIAYADFYAAGGVWELQCANLSHLGDALRQLDQQAELTKHNFSLEKVRDKTPDEQAASALSQLKRITHDRRDTVNQQLRDLKDRHTPDDHLEVRENSRCLLILDNVDDTAMLAADQLNLIPAEDWLSVIVTTRLSPDSFGAATSLKSIEVPPLNLAEGTELLRTFMPGEAFPDPEEAKAAEELVKALDGYTIALELIGAFVHTNWKAGARLSKYLGNLENKGLTVTDALGTKAGVKDKVTYQHKQIALIVDDSLTSLRQQLAEEYGEEMATSAQHIIEIASLLQPDTIPASWLEAMLKQAHPDLEETDEGLEPWGIILQALMQLSLLSPAERQTDTDDAQADVLRMHRVTAAHIASSLSEEGAWHWNYIASYFKTIAIWLDYTDDIYTARSRNLYQKWLIRNSWDIIKKHPTSVILTVFDICARLERDVGCFQMALDLATTIKKQREKIVSEKPESIDSKRELALSYSNLGTLHFHREASGDIEQAVKYYDLARSYIHKLYSEDPANRNLKNDLVVMQNQTSQALLARAEKGDEEIALNHLISSMEILTSLFDEDPENIELLYNRAKTKKEVGSIMMRSMNSDNPTAALGYFESAKKDAEILYKKNPTGRKSIQLLRAINDSIFSCYSYGRESEKLDSQISYVRSDLEIITALYKANPKSFDIGCDLAHAKVKFAHLLRRRGRADDFSEALILLEESRKMRQGLLRRDPHHKITARNLLHLERQLGDIYQRRGHAADADQALEYYKSSLKIAELLQSRNPESAQCLNDLASSQETLAHFHHRLPGEENAIIAIRLYEALLPNLNTLSASDPENTDLIQQVAICSFNLATAAQQAGRNELFQTSCMRAHQLLKRLKGENALNQVGSEILCELERMTSQNH